MLMFLKWSLVIYVTDIWWDLSSTRFDSKTSTKKRLPKKLKHSRQWLRKKRRIPTRSKFVIMPAIFTINMANDLVCQKKGES